MSQRQVEVVTSKDQMISDGDAMELHHPIAPLADSNQGEVRCSATHIADQNLLAGRDLLIPCLRVLIDPCIKRGLRFFDQHDSIEPGLSSRFDRQFASDFVERCWKCQHEILIGQWMLGELRVPGFAVLLKIASTDGDRRQSFDIFCPLPGEQVGCSINSVVTEP